MAKKADPSVPSAIRELVDKFAEHHETYHRPGYNETQLRQDFLDPFFEALGWDVTNRAGYAEGYRDVILEQGLRVEKTVKAPDYCFRIGGTSKFFVEAKKPAVDVKTDTSPAFQLRRYAWTAKLPLSILTDFEELAVYDCRVKPDKDDKASTARVLFFHYNEYLDRWDEIASVFSRDAILRGSFDKFAESTKKKRGTAEVDAAFLEEIEAWRESLAKNLSARNESLDDRELNIAVQLIIDRIIFLRMCEGRGIEPFGRLQALFNGTKIYGRLVEMFHRADERYNSGLFHFQPERGREPPDELTTGLTVDDKVLKDILRRLYYPESPYEFAALPADILGQVYEQFLGKVIRLTAGHRAKIEEKPEVRKAGGVYYTPKYIVDYIVGNTVGKLLEGKTPQEVGGLTATFKPAKNARPLSVLDPACGSGSFLIVAYQYLLDWYLKQYTEVDKPAAHSRGANPRVYQTGTGDWRLTIAERKRILLAHIYGVDIDYQAVEVTKLSLLLKVLEGATDATIQGELFAKQRALPDLANNIKCGNSLISSDFYDGRQREMFDDTDILRINAFDWKVKHGFREIFVGANPGFDAVIGNPPYLAGREWDEKQWSCRPYFLSHFSCMTDQYDLFALFIQRAIELLRWDGKWGFITPNTWLNNEHYATLRDWLLKGAEINKIADFRNVRVFSATVLPVIVVCTKAISPSDAGLITIDAFVDEHTSSAHTTSVAIWSLLPGAVFNLSMASEDVAVIDKIRGSGWPLGDQCDVRFGVKVYQKGKGRPPQTGEEARERIFDSSENVDNQYEPYLWGEHILRFNVRTDHRWIKYGPHLAEPRPTELFNGPRVLVRRIVGERLVVCPVFERYIADQLLHTVKPKTAGLDVRFLAGVLGSRALAFYFRKRFNRTEKTFPEIRVAELRELPIPDLTRVNFAGPNIQKLIASAVNAILEMNIRLTRTKTSHERTALERRIEATDREIDRLVYELYGLTNEEIALVEGAT